MLCTNMFVRKRSSTIHCQQYPYHSISSMFQSARDSSGDINHPVRLIVSVLCPHPALSALDGRTHSHRILARNGTFKNFYSVQRIIYQQSITWCTLTPSIVPERYSSLSVDQIWSLEAEFVLKLRVHVGQRW